MIYLDLDDLPHIAERTLGEAAVGDIGVLESALARPAASAFGENAYPSLKAKAAALLHSIVGNHGLADGNKRCPQAAIIAFYGLNGNRLTLSNAEAYELVMAVAPVTSTTCPTLPTGLGSGPPAGRPSRAPDARTMCIAALGSPRITGAVERARRASAQLIRIPG